MDLISLVVGITLGCAIFVVWMVIKGNDDYE
jgi:hypothetical protein